MDNTIKMVSEKFQKNSSGEKIEGITIMVDGILQQFLSIIIQKNPQYTNNMSVIQDALFKGLEQIKNNID
jgi:hypothetical protein